MNKNNDIMKDLTVFILYSIKMMLMANNDDSRCWEMFPYELSVLKRLNDSIESEPDMDQKNTRCHIAISIFYTLLHRNKDLRFVYNDVSMFMFQKDKTVFTNSMMTNKNYNTLNSMISSIGMYQIMDNLVNTPTA